MNIAKAELTKSEVLLFAEDSKLAKHIVQMDQAKIAK